MSKEATLQALSRVLIGLAWADGKVTPDEMNLLKDLIFSLPEITAADWDALDIYWMMPIRSAELEKLSWVLLQNLYEEEARQAAKAMLVEMVNADGQVTSEETAILREANRLIDREDPILISTLGELLESALPKRKSRLAAAANREDYIHDFMENHVFAALRQRYGDHVEAELGLDEFELRKLGLAGALMGRVAYADQELSEDEISAMQQVLQGAWSLHSRHAAVVVEFVLDAARSRLDDRRLLREFYEVSTEQERADFIDVLFDIARAQGGILSGEYDTIQRISQALKLPSEVFENARQRAYRLQKTA